VSSPAAAIGVVSLIRSLAAKLRIEGIIWGSPYIELVETSAIQSSTGYTVQVSTRAPAHPRTLQSRRRRR
jgi:hypothetical protein